MMPKNWRRLLVTVVANELGFLLGAVVIWAGLLRVGDLRVLLPLCLVRFGVAFMHLERCFPPLDYGEAALAQLDDATLLARERALARGPARFAWRYTLGWLVTLNLTTAFALLGVPAALPISRADLMFSAIFSMAIVIGMMPMIVNIVASPVLEWRAAVARALSVRGLDTLRVQQSIARAFLRFNVSFIVALFLGISAIGGMLLVKAWEGQGELQQLRAAERGAERVRDGKALGDELELVGAGELPAPLSAALTTEQEDPRAGKAMITDDGSEVLAAAPVGDGRYVVARAPTQVYLGYIFAFIIILPLCFGPGVATTNLSMTRALSKQLVEVHRVIRQVMVSGSLTQLERFVAPNNDELGVLTSELNGVLDAFAELSRAASAVAAGDLSVEFGMRGELHDAFAGMLGRLRQLVASTHGTAQELGSATARLSVEAVEREHLSERQAENMADASINATQLADAAHFVAESAAKVLANAEQTHTNTDEMVAKIAELNTLASGIAELLGDISGIADRSDLLALNGALEATRAGDAGRGFALVAAEMRRLAERVTGTVNDVRQYLVEIQEVGAKTVVATQDSRTLAERTASAAQQISTVAAEQSEGTQQLVALMHSLSASVREGASASATTRASVEGLQRRAAELETLTGEFELGAVEEG